MAASMPVAAGEGIAAQQQPKAVAQQRADDEAGGLDQALHQQAAFMRASPLLVMAAVSGCGAA